MKNTAFSIIWAPIIGTWAFLWAIYIDMPESSSSEAAQPISIIAFMIATAYLGFRFSTTLSNNKDSIAKVSSGYTLLWALAVATAIAFTSALSKQVDNPWMSASILGCVVVDIVSGGFIKISNEQLTSGFANRSEERIKSINVKDQFSSELDRINYLYSNNSAIADEIQRIRTILPYTSFTRSSDATLVLNQLRESSTETTVLSALRRVR